MDQGKSSKKSLFYSLKQRFWPNSMSSRSCFKSRSSKIKTKSESFHCNHESIANEHSDEGKRMTRSASDMHSTTTHLEESLLANSAIRFNEGIHCRNAEGEEILNNVDSEESPSRITDTIAKPENARANAHTSEMDLLTVHPSTTHTASLCELPNSGRPIESLDTSSTENNEIENEANPNAGSGLMCELMKLSKYGWYWGSISKEEAEEKLTNQPDGAFLLRDSSADHFILSLSFRSYGKTLHTRIEYSLGRGLFSFYQQSEESFASIAELIDHSMSFSKSAVYCYSRPRSPGHPAFPVRLTKPVSRFAQVRSLQHLCRFVIRESIRLDNIQKLPLPSSIKGYIEEGHY